MPAITSIVCNTLHCKGLPTVRHLTDDLLYTIYDTPWPPEPALLLYSTETSSAVSAEAGMCRKSNRAVRCRQLSMSASAGQGSRR